MSEIETSAWDGRPQNPEQSGWHWLSLDGLAPEPWLWCPHPQWFWLSNRSMRPADNPRGWSYLGPCITPAERDALAARVALAEGMAEALAPFADDYRDMWSEEQNDGYRTSDAALVCDGSSGINVGDLRTAVTALAAWRAAAAEPPASP